jgi:nucleoside-diphosphate-sugar epimerase
MIYLVTGATGFIGSNLIKHLLNQADNKIYALVRNPAKLSNLSSLPRARNLNILRGDLFSLPPIPADCQVVFHLAGVTKALKIDDYYTVNQKGTASLLAKLEESDIRPRLVLLSSLAAGRPAENGKPVKEEDPPIPASPYGHSKLLGEQEALKYSHKMQVIILRAAAIYGPGDLDFLQFFQIIKKGWLATFTRKIIMSLCYVDDLIRAIEISASPGLKTGQIYNVADPIPRTWDEIGLEAARILNRRVRALKLPLWLVHGAAAGSELVSRLSRKASPLNLSKFRDLEKLSWLADTNKIKKELGFETNWDFSRALEETLAWYQKNGWL